MLNNTLSNLLKLTKNLRALYVEDDGYVREETASILENIFKDVIVAHDGFDGFEKYCDNHIDIVLTDINMPRLNGIQMIEKIRDLNHKIPILILSAHSDIEYFLETIRLGIDGYILKPINSKQLFDTIEKPAKRLQLEQENEEYKNNLEQKVKEEISKREYQEKILIQQSKLAAMGEMIDAVAHQWKQPLNIMKMNVNMLQYDFEDKLIDNEYIDNFSHKFYIQIDHTVNTLDEFRSFFRPNSNIKDFSMANIIKSTLLLVKDEFIKNKIRFVNNNQEDFYLQGSENEFKHLILNIINNSKDAFIENEIENRTITINLYIDNNQQKLEISDNAGGIPTHIIDTIFKPNITTKAEGKGTGIGLYMSEQVATKVGGSLSVENIPNGAMFCFSKSIDS